MANLFGRQYTRQELSQYAGDFTQLAGTKSYELKDGRAYGVRAIDVNTGSGLTFTILPDRCLDIAWASFKGKSLTHIAKNGISSSKYYEPEKDNWFRTYFAGLLTTCGLSNTGADCVDQGREYGLHGRISTTPAEKVNIDEHWDGDNYLICVSAKMREAVFYGENLLLEREIHTKLGESKLRVVDRITNNGYEDVPLFLLYHTNYGFPLLDENAELILNAEHTDCFDEAAEIGFPEHKRFQHPTHQYFRQVFLHKLKSDIDGNTMVMLANQKSSDPIGVCLKFNTAVLPEFFEFKMLGQTDYQLGLEPSNCRPMGRATERARNGIRVIKPQETKTYELEFSIVEGHTAIQQQQKYISNLYNQDQKI